MTNKGRKELVNECRSQSKELEFENGNSFVCQMVIEIVTPRAIGVSVL